MNLQEGRQRTVISNVFPQIEEGRFPIKRIIDDQVSVQADIFADSHSNVAGQLLYKFSEDEEWQETPMLFKDNDRWEGHFNVEKLGIYYYTLEAWVDYFLTWQRDIQKKHKAGLDISTELRIGMKMIEEALQKHEVGSLSDYYVAIQTAGDNEEAYTLATDHKLHRLMRERYPNRQWSTKYPKILQVVVDTKKANFSAWYELFPRSTSHVPNKPGTFKDCEKTLPDIAKMGFDILYLPPIHPIGITKRRGKNNTAKSSKNDPGSPWAIGSPEGSHKSVHGELGTIEDFQHLLKAAKNMGIDIAMDLAYQCSPDHPYLKEHPEWFKWRPDGTIQHAENPPKKYEDIVPFYFENKGWKVLWDELKSIVDYWIDKGVKIFRVDNPHGKPFIFWEWLIKETKAEHPEVIFLSEAFTRPKVMYWLSKLGFTQSYTYFTWRHTKKEIIQYVNELINTDVSQYFRPNFWPNTPDILSEDLQQGSYGAFAARLILAATLSSNYGIYGPAFELMVSEALEGSEEYANAEKYEIKHWDRNKLPNLKELIATINRIRRENPALQETKNLKFHEIDNEQVLYYSKVNPESSNLILIVISLDPYNSQKAKLPIPLTEFNLSPNQSYRVHELLSNRKYLWEGKTQEITLNPAQLPACIFRIHAKLRREADFEYFT